MVRKLERSGYLKRYDNMAADERQAYEDRVGEWLKSEAPLLDGKAACFEARLQNVLQVSTGWNDQECQAFEEGARLLSALASTGDTWLPDMLYVKAAKRAISHVSYVLETVFVEKPADDKKPAAGGKPAGAKPKEEPAEGTGKATQAVGEDLQSPEGGPFPVRPKHIDQYAHLLPQKTQERAAQVKDLLRELDEARRKMALLMDDATAKDSDRETWAKKATSIDNKVRKIYDELDAEWANLVKSGRVMLDDLGNAHVCECPVEDAGAAPEKQELTSEQKARRRELRKWLVDTRRGNGDSREEHVAKWKENFREFLSFDGDAAYEDEKVKAAAAHYGIDLAVFKKDTKKKKG